MFWDTVYLSHVNLNPIHPYEERVETEVDCLAANLTPAPADRGFSVRAARKRHWNHRHRDPADLAVDVEQGRRFRRPPRPPNADPFAFRLAEQLNRKIGVLIRHHILERPCNAMVQSARPSIRRIVAVRRGIAEAVGRAK